MFAHKYQRRWNFRAPGPFTYPVRAGNFMRSVLLWAIGIPIPIIIILWLVTGHS
jgi:hypothetical protein